MILQQPRPNLRRNKAHNSPQSARKTTSASSIYCRKVLWCTPIQYGIKSSLEKVFETIENDVGGFRVDEGEEEAHEWHAKGPDKHGPFTAEEGDFASQSGEDGTGYAARVDDDVVAVCAEDGAVVANIFSC